MLSNNNGIHENLQSVLCTILLHKHFMDLPTNNQIILFNTVSQVCTPFITTLIGNIHYRKTLEQL